MAGRPCTVCTHPQAQEINARLRDGETPLILARAYGLKDAAIRRHRAAHFDGRAEMPDEIQPRARPAVDLIPQPHGGALAPARRVLFPAAKTSWSEAKRRAAEIAATAAPDVLTEMARLSAHSEDERVRVVAAKEVMSAAKDAFAQPQEDEDIDLSRLTAEEIAELEAALLIVDRIKAAAMERADA